MALRYVRKQLGEHWAQNPRQRVHHSPTLAYFHHAEPQREHARQSERNLEGGLGRRERRVHHGRKHLGVTHEQEPRHRDDERYEEKRYPNVIQYHTICKDSASRAKCKIKASETRFYFQYTFKILHAYNKKARRKTFGLLRFKMGLNQRPPD